jgi:hypothetical protein
VFVNTQHPSKQCSTGTLGAAIAVTAALAMIACSTTQQAKVKESDVKCALLAPTARC